MKWIPVEQALPDDTEDGPEVLIAWERTEPENDGINGVAVGYVLDGQWYFSEEGEDGPEPVGSHIRVTHWMQLPEHPHGPCLI